MQRKKRPSPSNTKTDRNERIALAWENGKSQKDLADEYEIHQSTVRSILLRYFRVEVVGIDYMPAGNEIGYWHLLKKMTRDRLEPGEEQPNPFFHECRDEEHHRALAADSYEEFCRQSK